MERRDWSLKALKELIYIDSLDSNERAEALVRWNNKFLSKNQISDFDLDESELKKLSELFFKSIDFLKNHKEEVRKNMLENRKLQRFLKH